MIPCDGIMEILGQKTERNFSGLQESKYRENTTTERRCNKCGLILTFLGFGEEVKGPKGDWRNITTPP